MLIILPIFAILNPFRQKIIKNRLLFTIVTIFLLSFKFIHGLGTFALVRGVFTLVMLEGFYIKQLNVFNNISGKYKSKYIDIFGLLLVICFRQYMTPSFMSTEYDWLFAPLFIYFMCKLLANFTDKLMILRTLAKYSLYIWLIQTFFIYYYFQELIVLPRISILVFLWALLICLLVSIGLAYIYRIFFNLFRNALS